jgi:hypothetical protein
MEGQILDADIEPRNKRKPISVWITGLAFGTVSAIVAYVFSLNPFPIQIPFFFPIILACLGAQYNIAAFGSRIKHFARIWASGAIVILCNVVALSATTFTAVVMSLFALKVVVVMLIIIMIPSFVFWIIPGKLPSYKNKIE